MAFDQDLAGRVRDSLRDQRDIVEKRMFGGLTFMVHGHMACGVVGDSLMVRVAPEDGEALLEEPHTRPMDFTGRPLSGFLFVGAKGVATPAALRKWLSRAVSHAASRPAKKKRIGSRRS